MLMSSNRILRFFNCLFWYSLYMLPVIVFIGVSIHNGSITSFVNVFETLGLSVISDNIIYQALFSIFGSSSEIMPLFSDVGVLMYVSYFASCYLVHFVVDVLLWLVRWAHKLISQDETKGGNVKW